ncbi:helix-hairpin-helix domain-containing protein [Streptomyces sp. MP131-18]|uniref:DNA polymerase Y family protein n=1 Tax=Streptomyces sp. MP131-18 TaxID=1857892 RepID=UPI00097C3CAF|nr:helix-hairpin-helix domain-containing protein [Streptomyces sp. MP131-18]ONK15366.1 DNA polymerase IV [Streptomyces sp. MP131-18]
MTRVLYVRFIGRSAAEGHPALLRLLHGITPVVQAVPPDAAFADVGGALRYFGRDAAGLAGLVRVRALALHGTDCVIGVAANPLLARMAADAHGAPGVAELPDAADAVAGFLADRPATALHGVGAATARTLASYGLDTVGRIAAAPPATLQRILGAARARRVRALAQGTDPTPVTPSAPARSASAEHRFGHDELDAGLRRRALLTLADELGYRLRGTGQAARALTLTIHYADRSTTTRSRTLAEPTAHTQDLTGAAYALHDALGLQRARVRAVALRAEELADAAHTTRQLSLDPTEERRHRAEAAADRARRLFGPKAATPAGHLDDAA